MIIPELKTLIGEKRYKEFVIRNSSDTIIVPKKLKVVIDRHISKKDLVKIDKDIKVAKDKVLLFTSFLVSTIHQEGDASYKALNSDLLHKIFKRGNKNTYIHTRIIDLLIKGTKEKGAILIVDKDDYKAGVTSRRYRLADTYRVGTDKYKLISNTVKNNMREDRKALIKTAMLDPIAKNNLVVQNFVNIPTKEQILKEGKRLAAAGSVTNKGKVITLRNKHKDSYWNNPEERSFVEDGIKRYEGLVEPSFKIPTVGDEKSGGRVVDSFTLMSSWIRKLYKLDNQELIEKDFSALHPNIINNLYGTNEEMISHDEVAKYLGITRREAKIEHLSFFNKKVADMARSPLWKYYSEKHPVMMSNLLAKKNADESKDAVNGHKETSKILFTVETQIMTEVISRLNEQGIYVIYVYDALYTNGFDAKIVEETMNTVVKEMGIKTKVG